MSLTNPTTEVKVNSVAIATQNILNINIHLGCTREVNSFEVVVNNSNSDYFSGQYAKGGAKEFTTGHSVTIKIKRGEITSDTNYLITGNLESLEYTDQKEEYQYRDIVILRGRCVGQRLFARKYNGDLIEDVGIGYLNANRWGDTEDLTGDAASAQKDVAVADGSTFNEGDTVNIYDDTPQIEENTIASISGNTLTMENNLSHTYTTANNALVAYMRYGDASSLVAYLIDYYTYNEGDVPLSHVRVSDDLASNATQYEKTIIVTDGSLFTAGRLIIIKDDNNYEYNRIISISTNTLTLYNPLLQNYTTAANCVVGQSLIYTSNTDFTKMDFTYETVFDIIRFIADTTSTGGVIGFDARIEYDGKFSFKRYDSDADNFEESYSLEGECQVERYIEDATRIKNSIKVFGKEDKPYPIDNDGQAFSDSLTESTDNWTTQYGSSTISLEGTKVTRGDYSIKVTDAATDDIYLKISSLSFTGSLYKFLHFAAMVEPTDACNNVSIQLDKDASNYFFMYVSDKFLGKDNNWVILDVPIGEDEESDSPESGWWKVGSLTWDEITSVKILVWQTTEVNPLTLYVDELYFGGRRWGGISGGGYAVDATSQTDHGVWEHVVFNDGLLSDTECEAKAQALLLYYKEARTTIELETRTLDIDDYPIIPGNKVAVNLPLHSITGNYRIDTCDINCNADDNELSFRFTLETTPPKVADYLYFIYKKLGGLERYGK